MAAKRKQTEESQSEEVVPKSDDPIVLKLSEIEKLSDKEKQSFRDSGGTSIEG